MIKVLNYIGRETVKTFTLDIAQPVKAPQFMLFPIRGTLEVKNFSGTPLARKKITVRNYKELRKVIYQSA